MLAREEQAEDPRGDRQWESIPNLVASAAKRFGSTEALVDGETRLSFADLADQTMQATRAVIAAGVAHGDRVAIWAPNIAEWVLCALGALGAGAVVVPLNTRYKGPEAADVLARSGAVTLFTVQGFLGNDYPAMLAGSALPDLKRIVLLREDGERGAGTQEIATSTGEAPLISWAAFLASGSQISPAEFQARWDSVRGEDLSDLIFTSGTTGRPKGAMTTHAQTLRTFATWASIVGLTHGDRYLVVNPFFHTFGYKAGIIASLISGATIVPEAVFDVDRVLAKVATERISMLPGPPTLYQSILDHTERSKYDLSSLRLAVTGAAAVPVHLIERMRSELTFSTVLTAYGLTESTGVVTMCRRGDAADTISATSGRAIPDVEVQVIDSTGKALAAGEAGEITVRGYNVVMGYFGDPEATSDAIDTEGWLHTGDVGVLDASGNLAITDRIKDMFIVGGFNVYPAEIEAALLRHPSIAQVAVIGIPDERQGEVGCAVVVARAGANCETLPGEVIAWSRDQMANFKVPRRVEMMESLPLNASGKVLKRELRAKLTGH